jgi:RNA polymerase sigma-70 factor (ECF subfamily)
MSSRLKEKFLLFRIRAKKDPDAFAEIYDAYVRRIYRFIYFKVPSAEQAEDLTSEAFLKSWNYLLEKREVQDLQALLYSVARSVVIDYYRASACERGNVPLDDQLANELTDAVSGKLLKDIDVGIDTARVLEKLWGLKDEYREVVVMRYIDEMTTREIARVLGKSAGNVWVILHRATKALGAALTDEPEATPEHPQEHQD